MPILEIFSQGEEVITGQVVDSNAAWLAQEGVELGFQVGRHTAVGDKLTDLIDVLREIAARADCCLCTGGLGPTTDDLTAEAVAQAFGLPLVFDDIAFGQIQRFFQNRQRPMAECNRKQAMLPHGALRIENKQGTAPGFAVQTARCLFIFMPGVPGEMKTMFAEQARPLLQESFKLQPAILVTLRTIGIGESDLQERLKPIQIPAEVQLGFRAEVGEVQVKLLFPPDYPASAREGLSAEVARRIGEPVYAIVCEEGSATQLTEVINNLMLERNYGLVLRESVSHGLVSAKLNGVAWLHHAIVEPGVVSACGDLREQIRKLTAGLLNAHPGTLVLIQLATGDTGQSDLNNKTITIGTGLLLAGEFHYRESRLTGNFLRRQTQAAMIMLDVLRRYLQNLSI